MEIEITSEGELIKYHGKGGDVVIPEGVKFIAKRDVFSSKTRIKSIFLPKSFIGLTTVRIIIAMSLNGLKKSKRS